jgi:uncharacterized protein (TIGR04222 family)
MNPFNLPGPEFLLIYFCFSLVVIIANVVLRRRAESGAAPKIDLDDPYLIAYLRGGEDEVLRVMVISLIDRGILVLDDHLIRRADQVADNLIKHPIEHEALKKFGASGESSLVLEAASILNDNELKSSLWSYRYKLERAGLMPDGAVRSDRLRRLSLALLVLGVAGVIKITIGISLGRPVGFLVVMMIIAMAAAALSSFPRLTCRGDTTLADITSLYAGLRTRINSMNPSSATEELAMFAASSGDSSGSSCGSSCSSSDSSSSCGSSDGGGGCGGCSS